MPLTGKSLGPLPAVDPRGSRNARERAGPPMSCPMPWTPSSTEPPAVTPSSARRDIVGAAGATGTNESGSIHRVLEWLGDRVLEVGAEHP